MLVEIDECRVLDELNIEDLIQEINTRVSRDSKAWDVVNRTLGRDGQGNYYELLNTIYLEQRALGSSSNSMKEFIYQNLGRIL